MQKLLSHFPFLYLMPYTFFFMFTIYTVRSYYPYNIALTVTEVQSWGWLIVRSYWHCPITYSPKCNLEGDYDFMLAGRVTRMHAGVGFVKLPFWLIFGVLDLVFYSFNISFDRTQVMLCYLVPANVCIYICSLSYSWNGSWLGSFMCLFSLISFFLCALSFY